MNILLDSDVLIDIIKNKVELDQRSCFINPIIYAEVLYGLLYVGKSEKQLQEFLDEKRIEILNIGTYTASIYTKLKLSLNKKGQPLADNDLLIAASCIEHNLHLYTQNLKHFTRVRNLKIFK